MDLQDRISIDPAVCHGKPCIKTADDVLACDSFANESRA